MELQLIELENNIRLIKLMGRLDIRGVGEIETKFAGCCAGETPRVLLDMSGVGYIASIGIRLLTINAKSVACRGGRMVILSPIPDVKNILEITGIQMIIPIHDGFESAEGSLLAQ